MEEKKEEKNFIHTHGLILRVHEINNEKSLPFLPLSLCVDFHVAYFPCTR